MKGIHYVLLFGFLFSSLLADCQLWKQYADSARTLQEQRQSNNAIELYLKAGEELQRDSSGTRTQAMVKFSLAELYRNMAKFELAESLYKESLKAIELLFGKYHADYATISNGLAIFYAFTGKYPAAEQYFTEVRSIREKILGKDHMDYAASCRNLGNIYRTMSKYDKAEPLFLEARKIIEKNVGRLHRDFAASCSDLAILYTIRAEYKVAEPYFIEAREIRMKLVGTDHVEYGASCNNLGLFYKRTGQYTKAEPFLLESKRINERLYGRNHPSYATDCHNLAALYAELDETEKAESLYLEAKAIREKVFGKQNPDYASTSNSLAILYEETGQFGKAEQLYLEAWQIRKNLGDTVNSEYASSCSNLSSFYQFQGEYKKAETLSLQAIQILEQLFSRKHPEYAKSLVNLSLIYKKTGEYGQAEFILNEAKQIFEEIYGKDHPDYGFTCRDLARLYSSMQQYEKCEKLYLEAMHIIEKSFGKHHYRYGEMEYNMAGLYYNLGENDKAHASFKNAFEILYSGTDKYFLFASETEKLEYINQLTNVDHTLLSFMATKYPFSKQTLSYNLSLKNRNLVLNSSKQIREIIYYSGDTSLIQKYDDLVSKKEELSSLLARPVQSRNGKDKKLSEEANDLEREVIRSSASFKNKMDASKIDYIKIQEALKKGEAAVEFLEFNYDDGKRWTDSIFYIALILRNDRQEPELVRLFEKEELDSLLIYRNTSPGQQKLNVIYSDKISTAVPGISRSLYDLIWKPLEAKLTGIKTVYFAPAGSLHKISFAALPVNNREVLSDQYKLVQLNTTGSVTGQNQITVSATDKINLYGGVQYDADSSAIRQAAAFNGSNDVATRSLPKDLDREAVREFYYLPGTEKEISTITNQAKINKYTVITSSGIQATEESLKSLNGRNSPAILHIATHGFFFPDPGNEKKDEQPGGATVLKQSDNPLLRSGLALAGANNFWKGKPVTGVEDGILTAYEVSNMYLPNTKLAVLSACETGLGDIQGSEGVFGLQRAFKMAGVENLLMSLWRVDDMASSEFMQEFYTNLFARKPIHDAFYAAQTVMKNRYRHDPYKWAAWVLIR